jgi:hypothetical protein
MRCAEGVPSDITDACLLWQRGTKLQYTKMAAVSQGEGRVHWDQVLKQVLLLQQSFATISCPKSVCTGHPGGYLLPSAQSLTLVNTHSSCARTCQNVLA